MLVDRFVTRGQDMDISLIAEACCKKPLLSNLGWSIKTFDKLTCLVLHFLQRM
jgi:hypothetical protein